MSSNLRGFFKKITGTQTHREALQAQPIADADTKLGTLKDATHLSLASIEAYSKSMKKNMDLIMSDKFKECAEVVYKYENKGEHLNPTTRHVLGAVYERLSIIENEMRHEVNELLNSIDRCVIKPLETYEREVATVKDCKKELREAYDKIDAIKTNLDRVRKEAELMSKKVDSSAAPLSSLYLGSGGGPAANTASSRMMTGESSKSKAASDYAKLEERIQRYEKELEEATSTATEKFDKYTEGLYKRIAEEHDLANVHLEYLRLQRAYHKKAYRRLESFMPIVKEDLTKNPKKPVFGCALDEYVLGVVYPQYRNCVEQAPPLVSPVIGKVVDGMLKQKCVDEEGIFRVAGGRVKMNCLVNAINAGYLDFLDLSSDFDVHCLAGVLKQYVRDLPESLLCDHLYDDWIGAISTQPLANKLEAFKAVLNKMPKVNYDNVKFLIQFLAKIAENSDKNKMTASNLGICFGVSLSSNSNTSLLNNSNPTTASNKPSQISPNGGSVAGETSVVSNSPTTTIDMATATNVFDFLLNNYNELFGASDYYHQQQRQPQGLVKPVVSAAAAAVINELNDSMTSRFSVLMNDKKLMENASSHVHNSNNIPPSSSGTITNVNRHVKKNSLDSARFIDATSSSSNTASESNSKASPPPQPHQSSLDKSNITDPGTSPRLRGKTKQQAPAPPPGIKGVPQDTPFFYATPPSSGMPIASPQQTSGPSTIGFTAAPYIVDEASSMPPPEDDEDQEESAKPTTENGQHHSSEQSSSSSLSSSTAANGTPLFPKLTNNTNQHKMTNGSTTTNGGDTPNRPPPIGFNFGMLLIDENKPVSATSTTIPSSENNHHHQNNNHHNKLLSSSIVSSSSLSSSSSSASSQEVLNSPSNTLNKPPKPSVPRRPGSIIAAQISKFQKQIDDHIVEADDPTVAVASVQKSPSEITSL